MGIRNTAPEKNPASTEQTTPH